RHDLRRPRAPIGNVGPCRVWRTTWSNVSFGAGCWRRAAPWRASRRPGWPPSSGGACLTRSLPSNASMAGPGVTPPKPTDDQSVGELIFDVSEKTSVLVREEIELAKAEVSEKVGKIIRGSAVGAAAGVFAAFALVLIVEGIAWLLDEEVFNGKAWPGFFVEAAIFLLIAAAAGYFAYRAFQAGGPPRARQA